MNLLYHIKWWVRYWWRWSLLCRLGWHRYGDGFPYVQCYDCHRIKTEGPTDYFSDCPPQPNHWADQPTWDREDPK